MRGIKSLFTEEIIEEIKQMIRSYRATTATDIMRNPTLNPKWTSIRCVENLINKLGIKCRVAPSKPLLSSQNLNNRLQLAENLIGWSQQSIEKIVFTDESKLFCNKSLKHLLRVNEGYKIQSKLFQKEQKNNRSKEIMNRYAISSKGPLYLVMITETLNCE
ncbi:hypothetical protein ABPG72_015233 [Tetrahymena utriculariae]